MNVICPRCMDVEGGVVCVSLDDGDTLHCTGCDEEYTVDAVRELIESWGKVLPWLLAHPARTEEAAVTG